MKEVLAEGPEAEEEEGVEAATGSLVFDDHVLDHGEEIAPCDRGIAE